MIRTDSEIKRDVEEELKYDAGVDSTDIGVSVKNGVVSLMGFVRRYSQKLQAEMDAKRVSGVHVRQYGLAGSGSGRGAARNPPSCQHPWFGRDGCTPAPARQRGGQPGGASR